ncbi:MAG: hypothetical protein L0H93_15645, partial [Nocardioides sp.]|nr:hypothetical protein [Nocardioides sp.]
ALTAGCGSAPETIGVSGVDELVIPTPSADPSDFSADIDNQFLPLEPGSAWTYRSTRVGAPGWSGEVVVTVLDETRDVNGIAATVVRTERRESAAAGAIVSEQWFAQDRRGNVWLLGRRGPAEGGWQAGTDGAEAGLAMPTQPRNGDGWASGAVGGAPLGVVRVVDLEATVSTSYDDWTAALATEVAAGPRQMRDGQVEEQFHIAGVGLVRTLGDDGTELDLTAFNAG